MLLASTGGLLLTSRAAGVRRSGAAADPIFTPRRNQADRARIPFGFGGTEVTERKRRCWSKQELDTKVPATRTAGYSKAQSDAQSRAPSGRPQRRSMRRADQDI